jgi:hypothetical protein
VEEKRRLKKKRSTTSVNTMYSYDDTSQSSDNEAKTDDESDFESINTSQVVEPMFNRSNSNTIARLHAFTEKKNVRFGLIASKPYHVFIYGMMNAN